MDTTHKIMQIVNNTYSSWLKSAANKLRHNGIDESEALLILSHFLNRTPGETSAMAKAQSKNIHVPEKADEIVKMRCESRNPLAYLLEHIEFYGLDFVVNENVMVPRPETEILVEQVLDSLPEKSLIGIDIGTGSGVIAVSLLKYRRNWRIVGTDISIDALKVATANANRHNVSDRFSPLCCDCMSSLGQADFVVSNPPYISSDVLKTLEPEVQAEPHLSLDGGKDGMNIISRIIEQCNRIKPEFIAIEFGQGQMEVIRELTKKNHSHSDNFNVKFINDFARIPRIVIVSMSK